MFVANHFVFFFVVLFLKMKSLDVIQVARYIENSYGNQQGVYKLDKGFRLWLQKVLYFLQGYLLKIEGHPLFVNEFMVAERGPMVQTVHEVLKQTAPPEEDVDTLGFHFVDEAIAFLSRYTREELGEESHESLPWLESRRSGLLSLNSDTISAKWGETDFEKLMIDNVQRGVEKRKKMDNLEISCSGPVKVSDFSELKTFIIKINQVRQNTNLESSVLFLVFFVVPQFMCYHQRSIEVHLGR